MAQQASAVPDRGDLDIVFGYAVDDAISVEEDLSQVIATELRNTPARAREGGELICSVEHPADEELSQSWRILSNVASDRVEMRECALTPDYSSHRAIRLRASSWVTTLPASRSSRPRCTS